MQHEDTVELVLVPAVEHALSAVAAVERGQLHRPTPCGEWTVADVLAHLVDSFACLTTALNFGAVPIGESDLPSYAVPDAAVLQSAGRSLVAAARRARAPRVIRVADREVDRDRLVTVGAVEAAVHGWDIARGGDRALQIPDDLAARLLDALPRIVNPHTRAGAFAAPVLVPSDRPAGDRLLAALGRDPTRNAGDRPQGPG